MGSRREDMYNNVFLVLLNRGIASAIAIDGRKCIYSSREGKEGWNESWFKKTWEAVLHFIKIHLHITVSSCLRNVIKMNGNLLYLESPFHNKGPCRANKDVHEKFRCVLASS